MSFDPAILAELTKSFDATGYMRVVPSIHASTPLGMGFGKTRFASPRDKFKLLYLASTPATAVAETVIRDRFQGKAHRRIAEVEFQNRSITEVTAFAKLQVLDIRGAGASLLNVPTDAVTAKNQTAGRAFSQRVYDETSLDGILYRSRLTGEDCVAIYDRAVVHLTAVPAIELTTLAVLPAAIKTLHIQVIRGA